MKEIQHGGTVGEPTCTICGHPLSHMADGRTFCPYGHMQREVSQDA